MNDNGHILVVDDQPEICDLVEELLSGEGYQVSIAQNAAEMLEDGRVASTNAWAVCSID